MKQVIGSIILSRVLLFVLAIVLVGSIFITWPTDDLGTAGAQTVQFSNSNAAPAQELVENDFAPEFRDLPTFDELFPDESVAKVSQERLIEIFDDGIYRQDEVVAKNGESWLTLVKKPDSLYLQRTTASVKKLKTVSWPGDEPDAKLSFNVSGKPIIALKNIHGLQPGPVTTLFQRRVWQDSENSESANEELSDGYRREFFLNDNKYILRTSRGITTDGTKVAVLVLELNGISQVIVQKYHVPSDDRDIIGSLLWAGDIDRDGKLDLYLDDFNEKGAVGTELHLSSYATSINLVGLAASFGTAGC